MIATVTKILKRIIINVFTQVRKQRFRKYCLSLADEIEVQLDHKKTPALDKHCRLWKQLVRNVDPKWYKIYSTISGIEDYRYVPPDIHFAVLEPILNQRSMCRGYKDKNFYERLNSNNLFPIAYLRNINGVFYDREYTPISEKDIRNQINALLDGVDKVIVKPALLSGGGRDLRVVDLTVEELSIDNLKEQYNKDYIVQEYIESTEYFRQFNPSSLNCIRINTYRSVTTNEVYTDEILLLIGGKDSVVSNTHAGGLYIDVKTDGSLGKFAVNGKGLKHFAPVDVNKKFSEFGKVPQINEFQKVASDVAYMYPYQRLLGFDLCLDKNGEVRVIEVNNMFTGIGGQMLCGSLFKEYTDEVIQYCKKQRLFYDPIGMNDGAF
ncbi:MAG: sugar-transfer associated ATP-grasp domain-containing protein [Candidatus Neomarinimicrobiota bacterium]